MNALGLYLLWSLGFVVGAFIEFAVVVLLSQTNLAKRKTVKHGETLAMKEKNARSKKQNKKKGVTFISVLRRGNQAFDKAFNEDVTNHAKKPCMFGIHPIYAIDFTAFWLFLILYAVFNCIYWIQYTSA